MDSISRRIIMVCYAWYCILNFWKMIKKIKQANNYIDAQPDSSKFLFWLAYYMVMVSTISWNPLIFVVWFSLTMIFRMFRMP